MENRSQRLSGKTIIVTGAAQGIGAAVATAAARNGARLIVADINEDLAKQTRDAIVSGEGEAEAVCLDVQDEAAFSTLAAKIADTFGKIDGLVNNAGINVKYDPLEMPMAEWDRCLDVNLRGSLNGCRAVLPYMRAQSSGSIINIASVHGHQIIPQSFPYPVSKAGLLGLTRALGVEYAPHGIRVNSISPGYVETPLVDEWLAAVDDPAETRAEAEALIPARRFGHPEEVGMTAVFLLADEAAYITAADIAIDGGRLAMYHR